MIVRRISCLLWNWTRSSSWDAGGPTGDGGRRVDSKGLDCGRDRDGGSEAGKERGSAAKRTKEEGKEGGSEVGRRTGGSALRTRLKSRGCNSSDLKTILNY